jgi:pimeloyl-ACP methyl ester carboxylesterase
MTSGKTRWGKRIGIGMAAVAVLLGGLFIAGRTPDIPVAVLRAKYGSPASRYITLEPGLTIHVRDEGRRDGLPLILMHGSNASLHTWEPWVAALKGQYRVITFDFPAHGLSGPVLSRDYSGDAYVRVTEKLVAHLGLRRFALGGNSMGGGIAWRYAVAHPEQVAALILVDASGKPVPQGSKPPLGFYLARTPLLRDIAAIITPRSLMETSFKQSVSVQAIATPAMIDRYWELLRYPGNRQATIDRFGSYSPPANTEKLRSLTMPALILWGAEDKLIPVSVAQWFSEMLPNARVTILDGVGHIPMEEAPERALAPVLPLLEAAATAETPPLSAD